MTRVDELGRHALDTLFARYDIRVRRVPNSQGIPGSYWGAPEAGIVTGTLVVRADTPVHSALHEGGHLVCMGTSRRVEATHDAGSDDAEECAVCYLQVLLADRLAGYSRHALFADMDAWGYSFRLGSARAWFEHDAGDAGEWLAHAGLARRRTATDPTEFELT